MAQTKVIDFSKERDKQIINRFLDASSAERVSLIRQVIESQQGDRGSFDDFPDYQKAVYIEEAQAVI